jgi:hypothetical protein
MPETDINQTSTTDFENSSFMADFSVSPESLDSPENQPETTWLNRDWDQQLAYYKKIPELKAAIDAKCMWVIGKGFKSNPITELTLGSIKGNGKENFNSILKNALRVREIGGDSYAEIIRDNSGQLVNLKPLDPSTIWIVANKQGRILRYEQFNRSNGKTMNRFRPEEMFHLSRDRIGDEIHGTSVVTAVEKTILARIEAIDDYKKLLHRNVYPTRLHHLDSDDSTAISAYEDKVEKSKGQGEDIIVPKGSVEIELMAVPPNATLNPLPWIELLNNNFYQEVGVPQIIVGGAQEITEASAKIAYLAWEQSVEDLQLYLEEEVLSQLNLEIDLEFPASLQNELLSDNRKGETMQASTPEDTAVTNVGVQNA